MRYEDKRQEVQDWVEDAMDTIADELDLEVPHYPFVLYHGRGFDFDSLPLSKEDREDLKNSYSIRRSLFLVSPNIVYLGRLNNITLFEESTHALHKACSNHKIRARTGEELQNMLIIEEMMGFFGSRILMPERINAYAKSNDYLGLNPKERQKARDYVKKKCPENYNGAMRELIVHQQGYTLGDRLFYSYIQGDFSKRRIKNLFTNPFREEGSATDKFIELRKELWPIE